MHRPTSMYTFVYVHMFVRMHVCLQLLCVRTTHVFTDLVNVSLLMIYLGTMLTTTIIQYILHTLSLKMILCDRFPDERSICDCYLIFAGCFIFIFIFLQEVKLELWVLEEEKVDEKERK